MHDLRAHLPVWLPIVRDSFFRRPLVSHSNPLSKNQHNLGWGDTECQPGNIRPLLVWRILELLWHTEVPNRCQGRLLGQAWEEIRRAVQRFRPGLSRRRGRGEKLPGRV